MKQHEDIIKGFKDFLRKEFFNLGHNNECEHKGCIELKDVLDFEKQVSNFLDQLEQLEQEQKDVEVIEFHSCSNCFNEYKEQCHQNRYFCDIDHIEIVKKEAK